MVLAKIKENINEKTQLAILERQQNNLQSLEKDFDVIYATIFLMKKNWKKLWIV